MAHLTHRRQHRAKMRARALRRNIFAIQLIGWEEFDAAIEAADAEIGRLILGVEQIGKPESVACAIVMAGDAISSDQWAKADRKVLFKFDSPGGFTGFAANK